MAVTISVSIPDELFLELKKYMRKREFSSRSKAITNIIERDLKEHFEKEE